jgi:hypothetical protein
MLFRRIASEIPLIRAVTDQHSRRKQDRRFRKDISTTFIEIVY